MDSSTHTIASYRLSTGTSLTFCQDNQGALMIEVQTQKIALRSLTNTDCDDQAALYSNSDVMSLFADGETQSQEWVSERLQLWHNKLKEADPYVGLGIYKNDETNEHIGLAVLSCQEAGAVKIDMLFHKNHWERYGELTIQTLIQGYIPATVAAGFTHNGQTVKKITATTKPNSVAVTLEKFMKLDYRCELGSCKNPHDDGLRLVYTSNISMINFRRNIEFPDDTSG